MEVKQKKKLWLWIVLGVILLFVLGSFIPSKSDESDESDERDEYDSNKHEVKLVNAEMTHEYNSVMSGWSVTIVGLLENDTNYDYGYVSVEFSVYDKDGNNLGTVMKNMNNLRAGETWHFNAESFGWYDVEPVSAKLADITYF